MKKGSEFVVDTDFKPNEWKYFEWSQIQLFLFFLDNKYEMYLPCAECSTARNFKWNLIEN
jgi:hypothetical protein